MSIIHNIAKVILAVLLAHLVGCGYSDSQLEAGKKWCESLMQPYKSDPSGFRKSYASSSKNGTILIRPDRSKYETSGYFSLSEDGSFECRYWEGGFSGKAYNYTSDSDEWRKI